MQKTHIIIGQEIMKKVIKEVSDMPGVSIKLDYKGTPLGMVMANSGGGQGRPGAGPDSTRIIGIRYDVDVDDGQLSLDFLIDRLELEFHWPASVFIDNTDMDPYTKKTTRRRMLECPYTNPDRFDVDAIIKTIKSFCEAETFNDWAVDIDKQDGWTKNF